jgi:15-cis-phytoene synthase
VSDAVALRELLPQPGSELYYALLFLPVEIRHEVTLLETFRRHIVTLPYHCSNHEIARAKLAWWHGELHTLESATSRHAVTRALAPLVAREPLLTAALFALVDGVVELLDTTRFATAEARRECYTRVHGPLWVTHAGFCGVTNGSELTALRDLGVALELAYGLRDLRSLIRAGLTWLCRSHEPKLVGLTENDADWYAAVAAHEVPYLRDALHAAQAALTPQIRRAPSLRALHVLSDFALVTLDEIAADGYRVWERRVEITPLRKLWRALKIRSAT